MNHCRILFLILSLSAFSIGYCQCECEPDKKYAKLLEQATDRKYDLRQRLDFLTEAKDLNEDCPQATLMLGEI